MPRSIFALSIVALSALAVRTAGAQLTLSEALRQADNSAYTNRAAAGTAAAEAARAIAPLQGILPNVRIEGGYARTTDPIGVFGDRLRQRIITQSDFDPQHLNQPSALGNYQSGVVLEQPVFNADAWAGRVAARHGAEASRAFATWTALTTRANVVRAYYGTVLAAERKATLVVAARSAHAHLAETQAMVRQGLVTRSDALLASVRAGDIDVQLAEAEGGIETARGELAVMMGQPLGGVAGNTVASTALPSANRIRAVVTNDTSSLVEQRADVRGAEQQFATARADAMRARSAYLPHINSVARYDWNSASRLYGGEHNWTVAVVASWNPFGSATELSDIRATAGRAAAAEASAQGAEAQAALEASQTRIALVVALTRLGIAEQSAVQSAEAHRIVSRKYEGGLASVVDLLDAQAVEMRSALGLSDARYGVIVAAAERRRAVGGDPGTLAALDDRGTTLGATIPPVSSAITSTSGTRAQPSH